MYVINRLANNIETSDVEVQNVRVSARNYPENPTAAFIKFTDTYSDLVHIYKVKLGNLKSIFKKIFKKNFPDILEQLALRL